jgi:hypothetical protein
MRKVFRLNQMNMERFGNLKYFLQGGVMKKGWTYILAEIKSLKVLNMDYPKTLQCT